MHCKYKGNIVNAEASCSINLKGSFIAGVASAKDIRVRNIEAVAAMCCTPINGVVYDDINIFIHFMDQDATQHIAHWFSTCLNY